MNGWMEMLYISTWIWKINPYTQLVCLKSLKTAATQSYQGETVGFCKTQPTRPLWGNSTAVKLLQICFQTTCIQGTAPRFEVCLGSIFILLLTPFLAVVSTELKITPLASGALNAKLCLVNKAVCLDSFCRLGSLNFNASSEGNEGVCQWRAEGGSWVVSANCAAVNYLCVTELTKVPSSHSVTHCSDLCVLYCMTEKVFDKWFRRTENSRGFCFCTQQQ